eukprot:7647619-Alexandrium_andersonii.AAC.1
MPAIGAVVKRSSATLHALQAHPTGQTALAAARNLQTSEPRCSEAGAGGAPIAVSYTHLRAHETSAHL